MYVFCCQIYRRSLDSSYAVDSHIPVEVLKTEVTAAVEHEVHLMLLFLLRVYMGHCVYYGLYMGIVFTIDCIWGIVFTMDYMGYCVYYGLYMGHCVYYRLYMGYSLLLAWSCFCSYLSFMYF